MPQKGTKVGEVGKVLTRAGSPAPPTPPLSTPPIPALSCSRSRRRQTDTHANAHTLSESGSSISPPSALLNPIVQTRGRAPRGLDLLPLSPTVPSLPTPPEVGRLEQSLRPSHPFLSPLVGGLLQAQLVTLFGGRGKRLVRNSPRDPSCHLPKLGRNRRYRRTTPSSITDFCEGSGPGPVPHTLPTQVLLHFMWQVQPTPHLCRGPLCSLGDLKTSAESRGS